MRGDHRTVVLLDGLLTRFTDYPPRPLVFALGVALHGRAAQDGLRTFWGTAGVNVGVIDLGWKSIMRSGMGTTSLVYCGRCRADGQTSDQKSGERGGDGAFGNFQGVTPEIIKH